MYMRQIEPWLNATGWGTTWPSLQDRDPDPDPVPEQESPPDNNPHSRPTASGDVLHSTEDTENGADEDSGEEMDTSGLEDEDGEDLEQPKEDEEDEEDGHENGTGSRPTDENPRPWDEDGGGEASDELSGDETDGDSM